MYGFRFLAERWIYRSYNNVWHVYTFILDKTFQSSTSKVGLVTNCTYLVPLGNIMKLITVSVTQ